jgi:hypothetical protein
LIVFVVGFGTSHIAADATSASKQGSASLFPAVVSAAFAQPSVEKSEATKAGSETNTAEQARKDAAALKRQLELIQIENEKLKDQLGALQKQLASPVQQQEKSFFKKW